LRVFAISDLHLSEAAGKPMDVFGGVWEDHANRIASNWDASVGPSDLVLIPGDISWAMTLQEAETDLAWIGSRPGLKVLVRGNHDHWWASISKVRSALASNVFAIQNDSIAFGRFVVCGTRGWVLPGRPDYGEHDEKIHAREVLRLRMSLESAARSASEVESSTGVRAVTLAMIHYPPIIGSQRESEFARVLEEHGVAHCVYGHLHGEGLKSGFNGTLGSVCYSLVSADYLGFRPKLLVDE
jgi:predicted phosphohydrolase